MTWAPIKHGELLRRVHYDQKTGALTWKISAANGAIKSGTRLGGRGNAQGRRRVDLGTRRCQTAQLAWFYVTGDWPTTEVEHRDGNPSNDAWTNLRLATRQQNSWNIGKPSHNTSGYKWVYYEPSRKKFKASITVSGKHYNLGRYDTASEAHSVAKRKARKLHGEYMRAK